MKATLLLATIISLSLTGCQQNTASDSTDKEEPEMDRAALKERFQGLEDTLAMAYNKKDLELFKRFYSEDAVTYGEGREQLFGRREMETHFINNVVKDTTAKLNFDYTTIDVFHEGELAVETGKWTQTNSAGTEQDHGFYMVIFKKEDGHWVSIRDIWNSSTAGTTQSSQPVESE